MAQEAWVQNATAGTIVRGTVVKVDTAADRAIIATAAGDLDPIGVVLEDIAAGKWGRIIVAGLAWVRLDNAGAVTREMWVGTSAASAGQGNAGAIPFPPNSDSHFREIGHTMQERGAGSNDLVLCILHFN